MKNTKQYLNDEVKNEIASKERDILESDKELEILNGKIKVEQKVLIMKDLQDALREDFKYSLLALEGMLVLEQQRNLDLKKDLQILKFREAVINSQFPGNDLD